MECLLDASVQQSVCLLSEYGNDLRVSFKKYLFAVLESNFFSIRSNVIFLIKFSDKFLNYQSKE